MTKQYERIAGTEESMILKEALEKLSEGSLSSSLEGKIDMLLNELREARMQREREVEMLIANNTPPPPPLDVQALIEKVYTLTNKTETKPEYHFQVERNHSGVLSGITVTTK